jgi:periplasmic protein TonB
MAAKNKPYEQFGTYILFKKLESDSLSELWRAARVEDGHLGALVALRRFTGGNRDALAAAASNAKSIVSGLSGTSFAKSQVIDVVNGVPFIAHEYSGGRSLRHIVDRARGGNGITPNPIPIDQAIAVAEKVALSLATTADLRYGGDRLAHGALIPQFVWITDDGEIRVAGQQLGNGIIASLKDARVASEIGRYFAPEYQSSGQPTKSSEVYSMGALLYLLVTGAEPPDGLNASAFTAAVRSSKTMSGAPIPDDIRSILDKSLSIDAAPRYGSMGDMKQAISALSNSGKYSATTFNLAFYVSNLLKKEFEGEALDRDKENKVNVAPYAEALQPAPLAPAVASEPMFGSIDQPAKSKMPIAIAAGVVLAAIGVGAFFMLRSKSSASTNIAAPKPVTASTLPAQPKPQLISQPLVATPSTSSAGTTNTAGDEAARKKAFEEAVQKKLQDEMMKLQRDYTTSLQQQQSKHAPVPVAPAPAPAPAREEPSAAQLDQQRLQRPEPAAPQPAPAITQSSAPVAQQQPAAPAPAPAPAVHEGDVIDVAQLDTTPVITRRVLPQYPPMALRQRVESTILVTALVSENGDVIDVKILRGDKRFGFEESALKAVRATKFSPGIKDGKHVKTWYPLPVKFGL